MKVTIEIEDNRDWGFCSNLVVFASKIYQAIPGRPTITVKIPSKASGTFSDESGAFEDDITFIVQPKPGRK